MDQVKFWVQLQHFSTGLQNRLLDRRPTVEPIPNPPVGVSPFLLCPTIDPSAVVYPDTSPATARLSMIRLEITAGLSHWEITQLVHRCLPLARRRPHRHYTLIYVCVCVCVCVCMCVCNLRLFNCLSTPIYLRFNLSPSSHPRLCPSYTPSPISPLLYAVILAYTVSASMPSSHLVHPVEHPLI